jgi:hypothetical protein
MSDQTMATAAKTARHWRNVEMTFFLLTRPA